MTRVQLTAQEIRTELQARINQIPEVIEDREQLKAPPPYWHEDDELGCNWNVTVVANSLPYVQQITGIVRELRSIYRLKT